MYNTHMYRYMCVRKDVAGRGRRVRHGSRAPKIETRNDTNNMSSFNNDHL